MDIKQEIHHWDGKSAADIKAIYVRHSNSPCFIVNIIDAIEQASLQKGATWLLKHNLESGRTLIAKQVASIFKQLPILEPWEAKLHLLQSLPFMTIAEAQVKNVEAFLRNCLLDDNKFVRAWAYNGFYELSKQHPEYREETRQFFEMAMTDEAPSVKARIRNIVKKEF